MWVTERLRENTKGLCTHTHTHLEGWDDELKDSWMNIAVMFICHLDGNRMECVTSQRWGLKWPLRRRISEQTSPAQDRTQHREDTRLKLQILNHQVVLRLRTFIFKLFILKTSKMASSSSRLFALFLLTAMMTQVMSRPSSRRPDSQVSVHHTHTH